MIRDLFLDLDDTLLDFGEAERHGIIRTLRAVSYTHLTLPTICSV